MYRTGIDAPSSKALLTKRITGLPAAEGAADEAAGEIDGDEPVLTVDADPGGGEEAVGSIDAVNAAGVATVEHAPSSTTTVIQKP